MAGSCAARSPRAKCYIYSTTYEFIHQIRASPTRSGFRGTPSSRRGRNRGSQSVVSCIPVPHLYDIYSIWDRAVAAVAICLQELPLAPAEARRGPRFGAELNRFRKLLEEVLQASGHTDCLKIVARTSRPASSSAAWGSARGKGSSSKPGSNKRLRTGLGRPQSYSI